MSSQAEIFNISQGMNKFDKSSGTCYGKEYKNAVYGFFSQFQDSFFYANFIQFLIVLLMYWSIGKGKYWKVLFYGSFAGLSGGLLENATVAYICQESERNKTYKVIPFLIDELFWVVCEYAIPLLNLIKMKAFADGKAKKIVNYIISGLFIPFSLFRFSIGYERMINGYLQSERIKKLHGYAFFIMAIADLLCTVSVLYFVKMYSNQNFNNISNYIKHSSYTILITVDIVGFILSILNIVTNSGIVDDYIPSTIVTPFHCLKSSFILILATDALLFKYGANASSINASSSTNSKHPNTINDHNTYGMGTNKSSNTKISGKTYSIDLNNNSKLVNESTNNTYNNNPATYNYLSSYTGSPEISTNRTIIKNYTNNINTNSPTLLFGSPNNDQMFSKFGKIYS